MKQVSIISVGKVTSNYLLTGINDYTQRIKKSATQVEFVNIPESLVTDESSPAIIDKALEKEALAINQAIKPNSIVIVLDSHGKPFTSSQLASFVQSNIDIGKASFTFIIGSSHGLSINVKSRADLLLSFSALTWPHQLAKLMLLEQIYRIIKINQGHPYHK